MKWSSPEPSSGGLRVGIVEQGTPPSEIAEQVLGAIREERFYILPHDEFDGLIRERMENVLARTHPRVRRFDQAGE